MAPKRMWRPAENLHHIAEALNRPVHDLTVFVLDKPRHQQLIEEIRQAGARIMLQTDGDVMGALMAAIPGTGVDVLMGIGGTPEGVIAAAAVKALGGGMQGMRAPQKDYERQRMRFTRYLPLTIWCNPMMPSLLRPVLPMVHFWKECILTWKPGLPPTAS